MTDFHETPLQMDFRIRQLKMRAVTRNEAIKAQKARQRARIGLAVVIILIIALTIVAIGYISAKRGCL